MPGDETTFIELSLAELRELRNAYARGLDILWEEDRYINIDTRRMASLYNKLYRAEQRLDAALLQDEDAA